MTEIILFFLFREVHTRWGPEVLKAVESSQKLQCCDLIIAVGPNAAGKSYSVLWSWVIFDHKQHFKHYMFFLYMVQTFFVFDDAKCNCIFYNVSPFRSIHKSSKITLQYQYLSC